MLGVDTDRPGYDGMILLSSRKYGSYWIHTTTIMPHMRTYRYLGSTMVGYSFVYCGDSFSLFGNELTAQHFRMRLRDRIAVVLYAYSQETLLPMGDWSYFGNSTS